MIPVGESIFLDTNILLGACDESRRSHSACLSIINSAFRKGFHPLLSNQVLREYLVVATRPHQDNGLGLEPDTALANLDELRRVCGVLDDISPIQRRLERLVRKHDIRGKRIHDANIVATMLSHGIHWLVSDNPPDFQGIEELNLLSSTACASLLETIADR